MRKFFRHLWRLFSPRSLKLAWSAVFNLDYALTRSIMPVFGIVGSIAYAVFHYTEKSLGFHDYAPGRVACIAMALAIVAFHQSFLASRPYIASRQESKTKMYDLEVVVTEDIIRDLGPEAAHYRWIDLVQVQGSSRHLKLFEIYGHQPVEVRDYKDETRNLPEKALTIYFHKGFKDASRLFHAMLENVPAHRHAPLDLMDTILGYYIAHCNAWNSDDKGTWQLIERWDSVHVFYEK